MIKETSKMLSGLSKNLSENQGERFETLKAVLHYFYHDNTRSGAHCRHNIKYHIVWIPKYRREVLVGKIPARLKEILEEIAQTYGLKIIAQEIMPDHVHVLVEAPPKYSPSMIVQMLKGISSRKLREEFLPQLKKHIWKEGVLWATGYYAASVSDGATTEIVKEYIETQWDRPYKTDSSKGAQHASR
ncbi:MAG: IS200/IS605 family transposase [Bdellovibrionota bacterium]